MVEIRAEDMKPQVYKDPRPAEHFAPFHERARTREPDLIYDLARILVTPPSLLFYRARAIGVEHVPESGPVILAPNHFSQWDHFFTGVYLRRRIRFMAKSQLFSNPAIEFIFRHGGVFPVRRGYDDGEAFKTAHTILDRGGCVLIYAEGGRSRTGKLGEPKRGVGRLALESGVPVLPVAIHGSSGVRAWRRFRFPKVTIQYGEHVTVPVEEDPAVERQKEVAQQIFDRVRAMYVALEENGRRGVLRALREGLPPGSPPPDTADARRL
jgi:1-acyl-sn-glycerol-3-phosphate acyltransferase